MPAVGEALGAAAALSRCEDEEADEAAAVFGGKEGPGLWTLVAVGVGVRERETRGVDSASVRGEKPVSPLSSS